MLPSLSCDLCRPMNLSELAAQGFLDVLLIRLL